MSSSLQTTISPSTLQLIDGALTGYSKKTGVDLTKHPFADQLQFSNSADDILQLFQNREGAFKQDQNRNRTLISCLSPAVRVLHTLGLQNPVSSVPFPPKKAIFVAIDVLLAAASGISSVYDDLLDLFESLGNFVQRLQIYTNIPPTPPMTDMVIKIMLELLEVLALATKQIKQRRFVKFAKKSLGESEVEAMLQMLDRLTQEEARMTAAQTLGVVHGLVDYVRIIMEDGRVSTDNIRRELAALRMLVDDETKMKRDRFQRDVQRWLSPPDPSTNHDVAWKGHKPGTAAWFFESNVFMEWKAMGCLLWIYGKPGSGKSTLLSAIIEDVGRARAAGLAIVAYYYFDFKDDKKRNCYGLLSSLLSQLSTELNSCSDILSRLYSENAGGTRKPTSIALTQCMKDMLRLSGQVQIYIIVDALDECSNISGLPSAREEVLHLIEELVNLKLPNIRVCLTSRPETDIRAVLDPLTPHQISLHDEMGQKDDILTYIKSVVESDRNMRRWKKEDKQLVIDTLSDKSDGVFRWVVCQSDALRRTLPTRIRNALDGLPMTLGETYARTLLEIDQENRQYAQRLFQSLTVSIRPLRVEELAEILAVDFDDAASPTFNPDWQPDQSESEEAVLSMCASLVSVVDVSGSRIVQFSHFSVKKYLTSERLANTEQPLLSFHILLEPAHRILALAGLSVLLQLDDKIDRNTIRHFPLALYAAQYWVDHVQFGDVLSSPQVQEVMERLFDPTKSHFAAWVWLYDIDVHWVKPTSKIHRTQPSGGPLYYASYCGFRDLVNHLLAVHTLDINARGGSHTTALHAALAKGNLEMAALLLDNGADPNSCDYEGRTPLHKVLQLGHIIGMQAVCGISRHLLNYGANVDAGDGGGFTPLHISSRNGYRDVVELLLESGARINARSRREDTPLMLACMNGMLDVARLLIDRGSDLKARNMVGWTLLPIAARYGRVDIARLLLDCGADVNACLATGETPLHFASGHAHHELAKLLIECAAEVDSRNEKQETPLGYASQRGHLDIARLLIEHGADVHSRNEKQETPLGFASWHGHLDIARLLIEHGAEVDSRNEKQETPLGYASQRGHLDIARLLIEHGAEVDSRNEKQETPLRYASQRGHLDIARLLIKHGADIHSRNEKQQTPLGFASQRGHLNIARLLIEHGAEVDSRCEKNKIPLHYASAKGHLDVARLLIERGASLSSRDVNGAAVDSRDNDGWTPLFAASRHGYPDIAQLLIENDAVTDSRQNDGWTPLFTASRHGHLKVVRLLLDRQADVHALNDENETALHLASQHGDPELVRLLIEHGADCNAEDEVHETPLFPASRNGRVEATRLLLERGATVDHCNWLKRTPLHAASEDGHVGVARLLLDHGAKVDARNVYDWTSLHLASRTGKNTVAEVLLDRRANVNAHNDIDRTPLHMASQKGHVDVVQLLLKYGANVDTRDADDETALHLVAYYGHQEVAEVLLKVGANRVIKNKEEKTAFELATEEGHKTLAQLLTLPSL